MENRIMDAELNDLILFKTQKLSQPMNYSFVLPNGTSLSILARQNVIVDFYADSGEYDPLIRFFFDHVRDYFDLTDLEDRSIIPVVFLQLNNDTAFGGAPQAGVSWFIKNVIVIGFQGSWATETGESGPRFLTHILKHEIGHWLSLSHHSSYSEIGEAKIICPMSCFTNDFCTFCKDSRARSSFISYYNATIEALLRNQDENDVSEDLASALQLFYDWQYVSAIETIISIYYKTLRSTYEFHVNVDDEIFLVSIDTNSSMSGFTFSKDNKTMSFDVERLSGTTGFCNVTIPIKLLGGPYTVTVDKQIIIEEYDAPINGTHAFIYFTFSHSTYFTEIKGATVIPEFQDTIILFLFAAIMLIVALASLTRRKEQPKQQSEARYPQSQ